MIETGGENNGIEKGGDDHSPEVGNPYNDPRESGLDDVYPSDYLPPKIGGTILILSGKSAIRKLVAQLKKIRRYFKNKAALKQFGKSIDDLSNSAGQVINDAGQTAAGRALTKHASGQRFTGSFPPLKGDNSEINKAAQKVVEDILRDPNSTFKVLRNGGLAVRRANGQGVVFEKSGGINFLDPRI